MRRVCGWCRTTNVGETPSCANCGGPLPAPPGADPGPPPGPTPRALPGAYTRGLYNNFMVHLGGIFAGSGALVTVGFGAGAVYGDVPVFPSLFGLLFVTLGVPFLVIGVRSAGRTIKVLRKGQTTSGRVTKVQASGTVWTLTYLYEVNGGQLGHHLQTDDPIVSQYREGDPLHVVYDRSDPSSSSIWPPINVVA